MHKDSNFIIPVKILYAGIILWILGISILILAFNSNQSTNDTIQLPFIKSIISYPSFFLLILIIILIPLTEELIFRYWIVKNRFSFYISGLGMLVVTYHFFSNIIPFLMLLIFFIALFVFVKKRKNKLILMLITSSIVFSLIHIHNYDSSIIKFGSIIQLFGLAMILSYIGIRISFYYCILGHSINNLIATIPLFMLSLHAETIHFENSTYNAVLIPISLFSISNEPNQINHDSITITGHISSIAADIQPFSNEFYYTNVATDLFKYKLKVFAAPDTTICLNQISKDFLCKNKIQSDTTLKPAYILTIFDTLKLNTKPSSNSFLMGLYELVEMIRQQNNLPLKMSNFYENIVLYIDNSLLEKKSINERKILLKENYGISISDVAIDSIKCVKFTK